MSDKQSRRKANLSADGSVQTTKGAAKAAAGEKKAQMRLVSTSKELHTAITALTGAPAGSAVERKARRAVRALLDTVIAAKRKVKKAQKKLRKAAVKLAKTVRAQAAAGAAAKRKAASTAKRRPSGAHGARRKPQHRKAQVSAAPPLHRKAAEQNVAPPNSAAATSPGAPGTQTENWRDSLS